MNKTLELYARAILLENLERLPESNHRIFRMMYARDNGKRSVNDAEQMPIAAVVAEMPVEKLDWAMVQVENSLKEMDK